jgi:hypothetical protein
MAAVWTALVLVLVLVGGALIVAAIDEMQRPHSNVRRTGAVLALVIGFAAAWILTTDFEAVTGSTCGAPVLLLTGLADCVDAQSFRLIGGFSAALASPVLVLITRGHRE